MTGKYKTIGKVGTGLTAANFIKDTHKDLGFGQAILKNGLTTIGSIGLSKGLVGIAGTVLAGWCSCNSDRCRSY